MSVIYSVFVFLHPKLIQAEQNKTSQEAQRQFAQKLISKITLFILQQ